MSAFEDLLQLCESEIRAGHSGAAAKRLAKLNTARIPRAYRLRFANFGRRTGMISFGLRVLTPIVRNSALRASLPATPSELAEYATLLQRCGAVVEAQETLSQIDVRQVPEIRLYEAFCLFNQWRYRESIPRLEEFIQNQPTPYLGLVGRVNLAAALVFIEDHVRALDLINECIATAKENGFARLHANSQELAAQLYLSRGDLLAARRCLDSAAGGSDSPQSLDQIFVKKWLAVLQAYESKDPAPLHAFRAEAVKIGQPEAIRDADFHALMVAFDKDAFHHLYFGTPFADYRESMTRRLGVEPEIESYALGSDLSSGLNFRLSPKRVSEPESTLLPIFRCLDILTGRLSASHQLERGFRFGGHVHRMLEILSRDFYQPLTIGNLFAELHPQNHFDIFSSPTRVRKSLMRVRTFLREAKIPAEITHSRRGYKLSVTGEFSILVPKVRPIIDQNTLALEKLLRHFGFGQPFTRSEACTAIGFTEKKFRSLKASALENSRLDVYGAGPNATYYFPFPDASPTNRRAG